MGISRAGAGMGRLIGFTTRFGGRCGSRRKGAARPRRPGSSTRSRSRAQTPCRRRAVVTTLGKKINGRKRHIVCDTMGLLLVVMVTAASVQDRDGGRGILKRLHRALESVRLVFADGGYRGQLLPIAKSAWAITVEVVLKPADQRGFAVLPRRWVVERTFSWLMRHRRLVRDYERLPETHEAMIKWAMIALMLNRLAPRPGPKPWATNPK